MEIHGVTAESTKLLQPMRPNPKPKQIPEVKLPTLDEKIKLRQCPEARGHTLLPEIPGTLEKILKEPDLMQGGEGCLKGWGHYCRPVRGL